MKTILTLLLLAFGALNINAQSTCFTMDTVQVIYSPEYNAVAGGWNYVIDISNYPPAGTTATYHVYLDGVQWTPGSNGIPSPNGTGSDWGIGVGSWIFQGVDPTVNHTLCVAITCNGATPLPGDFMCATYAPPVTNVTALLNACRCGNNNSKYRVCKNGSNYCVNKVKRDDWVGSSIATDCLCQ